MAKKRKSRTPLPQQEQQQPEPEALTEPEIQPDPETQPEPEIQQPISEPEPTMEEFEEIEQQIEQEMEHDVVEDEEADEGDDKDIAVDGEEKIETNGGVAEEEDGEEEDEVEEEEEEDEPIEKLLEPFTKEQLASLLKEAVTKYPSFVENVRRVADLDPVHRKIFVHGLGWDTTAETLISVFGGYGEVEDCKAVTDKATGKSKGYAFILFKHRSGAKKALKEPQKKIGSRVASCQLASAGPVSAPPPVAAPVSEHTQRKIFVSNVGAEMDIQKLMEFFSKFGEIEEGPLGLDKQTGKPKGFCLFVYKSLESARRALEEPHKNFEGHILHCQRAVDGPKMNKGGAGGGYQSQQHHGHHHHHHSQQPYYGHTAKKGKYSGGSGSGGFGAHGGHMMAPAVGPAAVGYNPAAPGALNPALGQALALLASQGTGLGLGNLMGGMGAPNDQGVGVQPSGYGGQGGGVYGQPGVQGAYANPQMPQGGVRPYQGGAPYMGHGH